MIATRGETVRASGGGSKVAALGAAGWLSLAAAPTFAIMALFTGVLGSGRADMLCSPAHGASPLHGMVWMYVLMSAFHSAPWLKLISSRLMGGDVTEAGQSLCRRMSAAGGSMGICVSTDVIRKARISTIHYSKNIAFTDYTTCWMVMSELDLIDLSSRLDLSRTDFRDKGHAIRYHEVNRPLLSHRGNAGF